MASTAWSLVSASALGVAALTLGELTQGDTLADAEFETGSLLLGHLVALWCPCIAQQHDWSFSS